jgi:iron complex outermembrane recepter protein
LKLNNLIWAHLVSIGLLAVLSLGALTAQAASATFEIESQDLSGALKAFAVQSHREIFFAPELARGRKSNGVKGTYDDLKALNIILEGTGLDFLVTSSNAILVRDPTTKSESLRQGGAPTTSATGGGDNPSMKLAQAHSAQDQSVGSATVPDSKSKHEEKDELSEIVVTGTHIRGEGPVGSSLTVYTRENIDQSGAATLDQFARQMVENVSDVDTISNQSSNATFGKFDTAGSNFFNGASFDLHGLGPSATLTLLNGHRLASAGGDGSLTDISLIPLSVVDHIEVLADGASAIYGADAVSGVVNIITRKDIDGAETSVRYGGATEGGARDTTVSQLFGKRWEGGNVLFDYEYNDQGGLDASQRDYIPSLGGPYSLVPQNRRQSVFLSGSEALDRDTTFSAEGIYTVRKFSQNTIINSTVLVESGNTAGSVRQSGADLSVERKLWSDWVIGLTGNYSSVRQTEDNPLVEIFGGTTEDSYQVITSDSDLSSIDLLLNGSLLSLPGGALKTALGGSYRAEKYTTTDTYSVDGSNVPELPVPQAMRHVRSAFGELLAPLVSESNSLSGIQALELSAAVRYDDYSDFGSTTNPRLGLNWTPLEGVTTRASYGTSFRAPLLSQLVTPVYSYAQFLPDPSVPSGLTDTLLYSGGNPDLRPEKATSYSAGFDVKPDGLPGAKFSATWFHVVFRDRISAPPEGSLPLLVDPGLAAFVTRNPSLATVESFFNTPGFEGDFATGANGNPLGPQGVTALFNDLYNNIESTRQAGVDLTAAYEFDALFGHVGLSTRAQGLLTNRYEASPGSPSESVLNSFAEPAKWKGQANIAWHRGGFTALSRLNFVNQYQNTLFTPSQKIVAWETVDLNLSYKTDAGGVLKDLTTALSITNLADRKPPYAVLPPSSLLPGQVRIPFDPVNSSPLGRVIGLQVTKRW